MVDANHVWPWEQEPLKSRIAHLTALARSVPCWQAEYYKDFTIDVDVTATVVLAVASEEKAAKLRENGFKAPYSDVLISCPGDTEALERALLGMVGEATAVAAAHGAVGEVGKQTVSPSERRIRAELAGEIAHLPVTYHSHIADVTLLLTVLDFERLSVEKLTEQRDGAAWLRPVVLAFARAMEAQLRANDHKPGWQNDEPQDLMERLREEAAELQQVVDNGMPDDVILQEAADVANFAMMVADRCRLVCEEHDALKAGAL